MDIVSANFRLDLASGFISVCRIGWNPWGTPTGTALIRIQLPFRYHEILIYYSVGANVGMIRAHRKNKS
jgi:hypothetical protein